MHKLKKKTNLMDGKGAFPFQGISYKECNILYNLGLKTECYIVESEFVYLSSLSIMFTYINTMFRHPT